MNEINLMVEVMRGLWYLQDERNTVYESTSKSNAISLTIEFNRAL